MRIRETEASGSTPARGWSLRSLKPGALALASALVMAAPGCCDLRITTERLPDGVVGSLYGEQLEATCGGGKVWFLVSGDLPPGVGLERRGILRGTPTTAGTFNFTVGVDTSGGGNQFDTAAKGFTIVIREPAS